MNPRTRGVFEMAAAMTISGSIGYFVVVSRQAAVDVVFWRCVFGALTLLIICAAMGLLRRSAMTPRQIAIAALGGVAIVINWLLLFSSYSRASISIATAVYNTQPFIVVAFGALFFAERVTLTKLVWLSLAFMGMLLIVQMKPSAAYTGAGHVSGVLMALGAAFFWALAAVIAKKLTGVPPHLIALIQTCVGVMLLAPFAKLLEVPTGTGIWLSLVTLGVVHTGFMYILLYSAIQKLPTYLQASLTFIYPVVAIVVDYVAFGHQLHPLELLGASVIVIAAAGMNLGWTLPRLKKA